MTPFSKNNVVFILIQWITIWKCIALWNLLKSCMINYFDHVVSRDKKAFASLNGRGKEIKIALKCMYWNKNILNDRKLQNLWYGFGKFCIWLLAPNLIILSRSCHLKLYWVYFATQGSLSLKVLSQQSFSLNVVSRNLGILMTEWRRITETFPPKA